MEFLSEGAEARIEYTDDNKLKKHRLPKSYRISQLDKSLRKTRNKREFKVLKRLKENDVAVPAPFECVEEKDEFYFTFEYIDGSVLKNSMDTKSLYNAFEQIMNMHNLDVAHGDLTTLNMIKTEKNVYIIDFGLSQFTSKVEDKAVDLNLFFTCIKNEHPDFFQFKEDLMRSYEDRQKEGRRVSSRLEKLQHRGRNK